MENLANAVGDNKYYIAPQPVGWYSHLNRWHSPVSVIATNLLLCMHGSSRSETTKAFQWLRVWNVFYVEGSIVGFPLGMPGLILAFWILQNGDILYFFWLIHCSASEEERVARVLVLPSFPPLLPLRQMHTTHHKQLGSSTVLAGMVFLPQSFELCSAIMIGSLKMSLQNVCLGFNESEFRRSVSYVGERKGYLALNCLIRQFLIGIPKALVLQK